MRTGRHRKTVLLLMLVSAPLWVACLLLFVETAFRVYGRVRYDIAHSNVIKAGDEYRKLDDAIFQEIMKEYPPPDSVPWNLPLRNTFTALDEDGRKQLAITRKELILVCDQNGAIEDVYPCTEIEELKLISETVHVGDSLGVVLPERELDDAITSIRYAGENEKPVRDYKVPLPNGQEYLAEFNALRISARPSFAVFLGDSRYARLGSTYRPNIYRHNWYMAQYLNSAFWTNSRGFRDDETALPKPDGVVRIVCVGGSTTVEGPHNELTYPSLLEKTLRDRLQTNAIEVINCGVDALGFPTEEERMPDWLALEPDLIIHYNIVNNMPDVLNNAIRKSGMRSGWKGRSRELAANSKLLATVFPELFLPAEKYVVSEIEEMANMCFAKMSEQAQANGAALAVASFAVPQVNSITVDERYYFDHSFHTYLITRATTADYNWAMDIYNNTVRAFCQKNNVLYIPVAENFSGGADTFTDICHLRLRGIELKAKIMADNLEAFVHERLEMRGNIGRN